MPEKPITTREEAHDYFGTIFASVEKNMTYLDEELIIENANQLRKLNSKFKAISENNHGYISGTKLRSTTIAETTTHFHEENTNLTLSQKFFESKAKMIASEIDEQKAFYHMPSNEKYLSVSVITHEYGHILENELIRQMIEPEIMEKALNLRANGKYSDANKIFKSENSKHARTIYNEIVDIARKEDENFKLRENLSKYGCTNTFEAFAEMFMNSQCGAPNILGKAMNKCLERRGF